MSRYGRLLARRGDVGRGANAQVVAQRYVVIAAGAMVVVDGHAEVVGLARLEVDIALAAREFAGELDRPGVAVELALRRHQGLAAFHDALAGDIAVVALVFTAAPLVQIVEHAV